MESFSHPFSISIILTISLTLHLEGTSDWWLHPIEPVRSTPIWMVDNPRDLVLQKNLVTTDWKLYFFIEVQELQIHWCRI